MKFSFSFLICFAIINTAFGQANYSLLFNGENSYVEFPFSENHDLFGDFSIEAWIKFDSVATGCILSKVVWLPDTDTTTSYSISFNEEYSNQVIFSTNEHHGLSSVSLNPQKWHHIAVVYTETDYRKEIYADGILTYNEANTVNIGYDADPLFIGAAKNKSGKIRLPYKGNIDEVRIWGKALTQDEVIFNMNSKISGDENNLIALWNFDEGQGNNIIDNSINQVNGINNDAVWDNGFIITAVNREIYSPIGFKLSQNYPNPFNPSTTIFYSIPSQSFVILKVYDILGNEVATLVNEEKSVGRYEVKFNAENIASGIYFYQIKAGDFSNTKKFILMK